MRLAGFRRLANGLRHFARFAVAEADATLLVAHDDESRKAEATPALHHLGDTVDVDQAVHEFVIAIVAIAMISVSCHLLLFRHLRGPGLPDTARFEDPHANAVGRAPNARHHIPRHIA